MSPSHRATTPARHDYQLLGAPSEAQADLIARALVRLGVRRAAVVHGGDGLDEVTLGGPTHVRLVEAGGIATIRWEVEEFGLGPVSAAELRVSGPAESAERLRRLFAGEPGPVRNVVLANTAAALWVAERAETLAEGVRCASLAIDSGAAARLVERWGRLSRDGE